MRLIARKEAAEGASHATYLLWEKTEAGLIESSLLYIHGRRIPSVCCLPSTVGCPVGCLLCSMPLSPSPNN